MLLLAASHMVNGARGNEALELILNHEFPRTEPGYSKDAWYPNLTVKFSSGDTALHLSCARGCQPVAAFLLENLHQDDLRVPNGAGDTALHHLLESESCDMWLFEQLLKSGGEDMFSIANGQGMTPLHKACKWGRGRVSATKLKNIFESGFQYLSDEGPAHICPLHDLIQGGHLEIVGKLISTGRFDLRKQDEMGRRPFSIASGTYEDLPQMIDLLLLYDSSLASIPDGPLSNLTPLAAAVDSECSRNFDFLLRLPGADAVIDDSWAHFQSFSENSLTKTLLAGCLEGKRTDLAKRILRDRKLELTALESHHWNSSAVKAWNDDEILPLMFLRQVIPNIDINPEIMDKLDAEVKQFYQATKDPNDRWIQAMNEIDLSIPFSRLASFAVNSENIPLVRFLFDARHEKAFKSVSASRSMREKMRKMGKKGDIVGHNPLRNNFWLTIPN